MPESPGGRNKKYWIYNNDEYLPPGHQENFYFLDRFSLCLVCPGVYCRI